mgnify:FL=1
MADQMDLLREQVKMLAGEVAFCTSSLKRLSEQVAVNPNDSQLQVGHVLIQISATIVDFVLFSTLDFLILQSQMQSLKDEIQEKESLMSVLERQIVGNAETACNSNAASFELSQVFPSSLSTSVPLEILDWRSLYLI